MTTPAVNDYEPTGEEIAQALGWDDIPEDNEPISDAPVVAPAPAAPAPAPAPGPVVTSPTPSVQPDPMRQHLETQNAELQKQQNRTRAIAAFEQEGQQYMAQLQSQGMEEQLAWQVTQKSVIASLESHDRAYDQRITDERNNLVVKSALARELSLTKGVSYEALMNYNDEASMRQTANLLQATNQGTKNLEARVDSITRAPVQSFDSNRITSSNSKDALNTRYASDGNFHPTPEQFAQMGL